MKLTREQEVLGILLIRKGGPDGEQAKELFMYFNQALIGWVARRYLDKGLSWEELLSAGNVGLLQAVNRFDVSRGLSFSSFAVPWIAGEIKQLFKSAKKERVTDKAVRATEFGVPLVDEVPEESEEEESEVVDGAVLENESTPSEDESEEAERLEDATDLQEAVAMAADTEDGLGMNAQQARSEGIGSSAGSAEFTASLRGEDPVADPRPTRGLTINFAPDSSTGAMSVDVNLIPALENALGRLEDPRQATVIAMSLGLRGHKKRTFTEIGQAFDVSAQRAHAILQAAFKQLREDSTLQMLFEQTF